MCRCLITPAAIKEHHYHSFGVFLVVSRPFTVGGKSFFSVAVNDSMRGSRVNQNSTFVVECLNNKLTGTMELCKSEGIWTL